MISINVDMLAMYLDVMCLHGIALLSYMSTEICRQRVFESSSSLSRLIVLVLG